MNSYAILLMTASWVSGSAGETPNATTPYAPSGSVVQTCHRSCAPPSCAPAPVCDTSHRSLCRRPARGCHQPCEKVILEHGCPCKQVLGNCCCRRSLLRRLLDRLANCRLCCRRNRCKQEPVVCHVVQSEPAPCQPAPTPVPEPEPVKKMPEPKAEPPKPAPLPVSFEIKKEYLPKVGHADDYSWITGQLFYIHAEGGMWLVRYAPHEKEDRYGGSVVLANSINMDGSREGDLVTVRGGIIHEGRASKFLGGPPYRPSGLDLVERLK